MSDHERKQGFYLGRAGQLAEAQAQEAYEFAYRMMIPVSVWARIKSFWSVKPRGA